MAILKNTVIGSYAVTTNREDGTIRILTVGTGKSGSEKNAFEVLDDGRAKVQTKPSDPDDVVRKLELDSVKTIANNAVVANGSISSGTHTKITYDSKGLVTGGTDLAVSDIPSLPTSKITSGTFPDDRIASASTWNAKLDKAGGTISGSLIISKNLIVNGTTSTVETQSLKVADKLIYVAKGNTVALTSPAGLITPKYDGTNNGGIVYDNTGTAYVGDITLDSNGNVNVASSDLQAIATRNATITDGNIVKWDNTNKTLVDSGKKIGDLVLANTAITGGTHTKITYDSKGLVTGGTDLAVSDIPSLPTSKITSGTFPDSRIASASTWNNKQNALTATQLSAVNSGITSSKVSTYDGYAGTLANKLDKAGGTITGSLTVNGQAKAQSVPVDNDDIVRKLELDTKLDDTVPSDEMVELLF